MMYDYLKKKIKNSAFIKSFLTLLTGTSIAQAIPILLSPVLSRIYAPEDFGLFALFFSIVSAFAVIAGGRYECAVILPKKDGEALGILKLAFRISMYLAAIVMVIMVFSELFLWDHFVISADLRIWLLIMPIFILMFGLTQTITNWFVRKKQFRDIATGRVVQSVVINGSMLVFGFCGFSYWGIFWGNLIGLAIFTLLLFFIFFKSFNLHKSQIHYSGLKVTAKKYKDFPLANGPQALIDMFQVNGIIYLISAFFSSVITGLYSFAYRLLMSPMNLVGSALAQVFYQQAAETYNSGNDIRPLIKKNIVVSSVIIIPVLLILMIAGPSVFAVIFGENWREAGEYARILSPWFCLDFVRAPISQVPMIVGKIKKMLSFTFIGSIILVTTMLAGGIFLKDIKLTFIILSVAMSLYTLGIIIWLFRSGKKPDITA